MADRTNVGGPPVADAVWSDGVTIAGNGTRSAPLHALGGGAGSIVHDGTLRGDGTLASPLGTDPTIELTNGDVVPLVVGMPVAADSVIPSTIKRANATSQALATVVGLVTTGAGATLQARIKALGVLQLATALWDVITGQTGGLSPGANYFLAPVAGMMTTTPPITAGQSLTRIGYAIDAQRFAIDPELPVLL